MRKALLAGFVLLTLVVAAAIPPPVAATQDDGLAPDGVTIHIDIQSDGDAYWTIGTSYVLNETSDERAFDEVAASFEREQGDLGFSIRTFEQVVPRVEARTGRDMSVRDPAWTSTVETDAGVTRGYLRLSFTWTNFSRLGNETVSLGGVFEGGWFGDLGPDQTLIVSPPAGYDVGSAQPSHETVNGTLRWTGPIEFAPNEPVATFRKQQPPTSPTPPGPAWLPWTSITGAIVTALIIGGIIAYTWFWRSERGWREPAGQPSEAETGATTGDEPGTETGGEAGTTEASGGETADGAAGEATSEAENGIETGGAGAVAGAAAGESEPESESEPEPELLSDEERVERLLDEQGGRMKQAKIVEETRWSNAKVSQLLSQMADAGRIEKLRIGRENLISIPEDSEDDDTGNDYSR